MSEVYVTPQHEWILFDENKATIGLIGSALAGDIVYIELPAIGQTVEMGVPCASVESTKLVYEVHAPASGVISAVNDTVYDDPDSVAKSRAWLFTVEFHVKPDTSGWQRENES